MQPYLVGPGDDFVVDVRDVHAQRHVVAEEIGHHPTENVEVKVRSRCPSQVKKSDARWRQLKSGQVGSSQVKSGQVTWSPFKSGQVKSSPFKSSQARSSRVKSGKALPISSRSRGVEQGSVVKLRRVSDLGTSSDSSLIPAIKSQETTRPILQTHS